MNFGYARVSTEEQNLDLQMQALEAAGCTRIFRDRGLFGAAGLGVDVATLRRVLRTSTDASQMARSRLRGTKWSR